MNTPTDLRRASRAGAIVLIAVPTAAWTNALAVLFAARLRRLPAALASP